MSNTICALRARACLRLPPPARRDRAGAAGRCNRDAAPPRERSAAPSGAAVGSRAGAEPMLPPGAGRGEWTIPSRDYASTRFSALDQITADNVGGPPAGLDASRPACCAGTRPRRSSSATRCTSSRRFRTSSTRSTSPTGALKWKYEPGAARAAQGVACCDVVNRGAAYADGEIFFNTLDGTPSRSTRRPARRCGRRSWATSTCGETMTMAPLVVKGKVLVGNSGGEFGVRGWLTALDAATGQDRLARLQHRPRHGRADRPATSSRSTQRIAGTDLGVTTWPPDQWKIGGGTVWGWISYDPELNLIYYGTGNPGVVESGAAAGRQQVVRRHLRARPDTGEARWAYQIDAARRVRLRRRQREASCST